MEKGWVVVHRSTTPVEVDIIKTMLENEGIPCIVLNQRDSSYLSFGEVSLYVKNTDFIRARGLIDRRSSS